MATTTSNSQQKPTGQSQEPSFETHWPKIQPIVKKLIYSQEISKLEWQNIFCDVHIVCTWDSRGPHKLLAALEKELMKLLILELKLDIEATDHNQSRLREYIKSWSNFKLHCQRFPVAFQQLDLATKKYTIQAFFVNPIEGGEATTHGYLGTVPTQIPTKRFERSTVRTHLLTLWKKHILEVNYVRLDNCISELILDERTSGSTIDRQLILAFVDSLSYIDFHSGKLYNMFFKAFENKYFEELEIYYASRVGEMMQSLGIIEYIKWALDKIQKEETMAKVYLGDEEQYLSRLNHSCNQALVVQFVDQVLNESSKYIRSDDSTSTNLIFRFVDRINGSSKVLLRELSAHIAETGVGHLLSCASSPSNSEKFVEKLLDLYEKFYNFTKSSLGDEKRVSSILEDTFKIIVNDTQAFNYEKDGLKKDSPKLPELLATYLDLLLRKTNISRKLSPDELNCKIDVILFFVKLLKDKELFMRYYKSYFGRRLILNASIDKGLEEDVLRDLRLQGEVPNEYLYKLIRMFKDLKSSEEVRQEFKKRLPVTFDNQDKSDKATNNNNNNNNTIHTISSCINNALVVHDNNNKPVSDLELVNFIVLNPTAWTKTNERYTISLPQKITSELTRFESFYNELHPDRKLEWCHRLSHGTVSFKSDKGEFELEVSAAQLAILTIFNDNSNGQTNFQYLENTSSLNSAEFRRALWSLVANPKLKIQPILCEPLISDIKDLDLDGNLFTVNNEFVLMKNGKPLTKGRVSLIGRLQI